jgi:hypothetical protein
MESENEGGIVYKMSLILLLKIIIGSLKGQKNQINCIIISGELININGLDRLRMIFEKSTNNYNKLFISIAISNIILNFHLPQRFIFVYDYLKNYLMFFYNQLLSSSSSTFLHSSPFFVVADANLEKSFKKHCCNELKDEIQFEFGNKYYKNGTHSSFTSSLFCSISNEKVLFYTLSGLLSISSNNNYEILMKKDIELLIQILYFLSMRSNCEIKETIISIIYNIIRNEKIIVEKENKYIEIINKYKILKYLILTIKEENDNKKVIIHCLRYLLFIYNNSYEEIIKYDEKIIIEILDEILKFELNKLSFLLKIKNKKEFEKYSETVYFYIFTLLFNSDIIFFFFHMQL